MGKLIVPHPALRHLAAIKLRALLRQQKRRLKKPSGIFFVLLGLSLFGLWFATLASTRWVERRTADISVVYEDNEGYRKFDVDLDAAWQATLTAVEQLGLEGVQILAPTRSTRALTSEGRRIRVEALSAGGSKVSVRGGPITDAVAHERARRLLGAVASELDLERLFLLPLVQLVCLIICIMTVIGALNHRGLYMPKEEIERLLSAPVSRSDLVRYRLISSMGRSLFAGLIFGFLSIGRLPNPVFGFVGIFITMLTTPIIGQAASLISGDAENRLSRFVAGKRIRLFNIIMGVLIWLAFMGLIFGDALGEFVSYDVKTLVQQAKDLVHHPVLTVLLTPFKPWALMITAADPATFFLWLTLCALIWFMLFELTARIRVDFRELSLATSADVARRMRRMGTRGFGVSSARISRAAAGRSVPWLFGRKSFGAVAWLKLASIFRKARGTILLSVGIVGFLTVVFSGLFRDPSPEEVLGGATLIATIGVFYLCAGLRFDFRMDLDQMASVKAWPVRPSLLFLATLLPEVVLVSALLSVAIGVRAAVTQAFHPGLFMIIACLPLFTLGWVAVDNAIFLYAPVRFIPGQEGALHHTGRSFVLLFLRMILLMVFLAGGGLSAVLGGVGAQYVFEGSEVATYVTGAITGWLGLVGMTVGVVLFGGMLVRRFDVARDRG